MTEAENERMQVIIAVVAVAIIVGGLAIDWLVLKLRTKRSFEAAEKSINNIELAAERESKETIRELEGLRSKLQKLKLVVLIRLGDGKQVSFETELVAALIKYGVAIRHISRQEASDTWKNARTDSIEPGVNVLLGVFYEQSDDAILDRTMGVNLRLLDHNCKKVLAADNFVRCCKEIHWYDYKREAGRLREKYRWLRSADNRRSALLLDIIKFVASSTN